MGLSAGTRGLGKPFGRSQRYGWAPPRTAQTKNRVSLRNRLRSSEPHTHWVRHAAVHAAQQIEFATALKCSRDFEHYVVHPVLSGRPERYDRHAHTAERHFDLRRGTRIA